MLYEEISRIKFYSSNYLKFNFQSIWTKKNISLMNSFIIINVSKYSKKIILCQVHMMLIIDKTTNFTHYEILWVK